MFFLLLLFFKMQSWWISPRSWSYNLSHFKYIYLMFQHNILKNKKTLLERDLRFVLKNPISPGWSRTNKSCIYVLFLKLRFNLDDLGRTNSESSRPQRHIGGGGGGEASRPTPQRHDWRRRWRRGVEAYPPEAWLVAEVAARRRGLPPRGMIGGEARRCLPPEAWLAAEVA